MQRFSSLLSFGARASLQGLLRPSVAAFESAYMSRRPPKDNEDIKTLRARLLYQSKKRGILENDILIGDFAEEKLGEMNQEQLLAYDRLINGEHMEWDLYYYVSGRKPPPSEIQNCSVFKMLKSYVERKAQAAKES